MELTEYLRIARKRWFTIAATLALTLALAALLTATATKQYSSTTRFFVSTQGSAADATQQLQGSTFSQQRVKSYSQLLKTPKALEPAIDELDDDISARKLADRVAVKTVPDTVMLDVTVTDPSPERAQEIADAIGDTFPDVVDEIETPQGRTRSPVKVSVVEPASYSDVPVSPNPVRNLVLGAVLGLLLGFGLALLRHMLDTIVRTGHDVEEITDEPIIGAVHFDPKAKKDPLIVESDPSSPRSEAFRALRTNLMFVNADHRPKTIALTSSIPGEGKSTTIANLALTLAKSGSRVCLVEGDLRRPRLLDYLGLDGAAGLTDVLIDRAHLDDVLQPYGRSGLDVLGAGAIPPNPSELLASAPMTRLLAELSRRYDYVLVDTPPVLPVTDAVVVSTQVDGVIVLVGTTIVRKDQLRATFEALSAVDNTILGLVLNRVGRKAADGYGAGYYGYYEYDGGLTTADTTRSAKKKRRLRLGR